MDADAEFRGVSGPAEPAFRSVLSGRQRRGVNWGVSARIPPVDLYETDEAFVLKAKLPGLTTDEIQIEAHGRTLTLRETGVRPIRQENKLLMPAAFSPVR
jgi:HSP20 family molecular chaperone IbpA